jgi:hypothetical protein
MEAEERGIALLDQLDALHQDNSIGMEAEEE